MHKQERRFLFSEQIRCKCTATHDSMILTTSRRGGTYTDRVLNFFSLILYRNERRMFGAVVLHRHRKKRSMQCKGSCSCCSPLWMARSDRPRRGGGVGRCIRLGPLAGRRGTCACRWGGGGHGGIRRQGPRLQVPGREDPARRRRRRRLLLLLLLGAEAEPQLQLVVVLTHHRLLVLLLTAGVLLHLLRGGWRRLAGYERRRGPRSPSHRGAALVVVVSWSWLCDCAVLCVVVRFGRDTSRERKGAVAVT